MTSDSELEISADLGGEVRISEAEIGGRRAAAASELLLLPLAGGECAGSFGARRRGLGSGPGFGTVGCEVGGVITSGRSSRGAITSGAAAGGVDDAPGTPGSAQCGMASLIELTGGFISPRILSAISRPEMHTSRPEVPEPVPLQNLSQNLDKSRVNLENLEVLETAACRASPALG